MNREDRQGGEQTVRGQAQGNRKTSRKEIQRGQTERIEGEQTERGDDGGTERTN